jgi:YHS domain-containing protein
MDGDSLALRRRQKMGAFDRLFGEGDRKARSAMPASKAATGAKTARDPVCGMDVDMEKPPATSVYQGKTYYFCAPGCKKAFDANPAKYLQNKSADSGRQMH